MLACFTVGLELEPELPEPHQNSQSQSRIKMMCSSKVLVLITKKKALLWYTDK
jgi:hypothetical protein